MAQVVAAEERASGSLGLVAQPSHYSSLPHITVSGRRSHAGGSVPLQFSFYRQDAGFARTISSFVARGFELMKDY